MYSEYFDETIEFDCDEALERGPKGEWANYYKGMCHFYLPEMPDKQLGFDMVFISNVTIGGGISSSAAVEVRSLFPYYCRFPVPCSSRSVWALTWIPRIAQCAPIMPSTSSCRCLAVSWTS